MSLDQTIDALTHLLETGDEADRCYVTQALGKLTQPEVAAPISLKIIPYLRDQDIDVCVDVAATLGKLGGEGVADALLESLEKDPDGEIKTAIARALGELGDPSAIPGLIRVMENRDEEIGWIEEGWDLWWDVQLAAVKSLGKLRAADAIPALIRVLNSVEGEDIETDILRALAEIDTEESLQALEKILNGDDAKKQRRAATALGQSKSPQAIRILGRALNAKHADVRMHTIQALEAQDAKRYLPAIMLLLKDPSDEVRTAAVKAATSLGEMKNPTQEAVDLFTGLLNDESTLVRATALNTLANLSSEVLAEKLSEENINRAIDLIGDPNIETSTAATRLFSRLRSDGVESRLIELLMDRNNEPAIRRQAALSLRMVHQPGDLTVEALTAALNDPEQAVRLAALVSLIESEKSYTPSKEDRNEEGGEPSPRPRPIDIVIAALRGEIELSEEEPQKAEAHTTDEMGNSAAESESPPPKGQQVQFNPEMDEKNPSSPVAEEQGSEEPLPLPDFPESPTVEGERRESLSTLETIAMDNVEAALMLDATVEETEEEHHDEETQEYLDILKKNQEAADRRERRFKSADIQSDVRRMAATMLGRHQSEAAIDELNRSLNDEDHEIRRLAAEALAEIARANPSNPALLKTQGSLISQIHFGDPDIRMAAIRALGAMENRAALPTLMERLEDEDTVVRMESIRAQVAIALSDLDPEKEGHMVTHEISNHDLLLQISEMLTDSQPSVRKYAADGITALLKKRITDEENTAIMIRKILDAGFAGAGEQARHMGQALRTLDPVTSTGHLLPLLRSKQSSAERRFVIEMLEEIHHKDRETA